MTMLTLWAWVALALGVLTALAIAWDVKKRPQHMAIMNVTWPITGLYMPIIGWWAYATMGRAPKSGAHHDHAHHHHGSDTPKWQGVFVSATHCGGGCTLGDVVASPIATLTAFSVFGSAIAGHFLLAFVFAYAFGVLFQYLPIREMSDSGPAAALKDAIKADTLSLIAFQIGMYVWMIIAASMWLGEMNAFTPEFWFMMQIAMLVGFITSYPANWVLIKRGIKHAM
ncbi:DUF4396 domain-containing protein [Larsenimonas suaedae]|uniref:DUF4396 domain-containing protein n=1 Tax=Larsenimonas suaedae TaxID=1851019 RepID=A0ABU1GU27_9GAMM|nr:DUF4396 domain-containing protein [Larsenimonas suaedae]MCM2972202.1 DUF4396 domain-containing protein [Larsenimonas suaedae]MDR5895002.1 DUF4396 domain-containing protein [Larsenimonas suaedae]